MRRHAVQTPLCRLHANRGHCGWRGAITRAVFSAFVPAPAFFLFVGCARPNAANVALRKENQNLQRQIEQLKQELDAKAALVTALSSRPTTIPSLPPQELEKLFTVNGIAFGRLTGGYNTNSSGPDVGIKVFAVPVDAEHQPLKAAGSFLIEAFDLAAAEPRIGRWTIPLEEARQTWHGYFLWDYYYVLNCPWQTVPQHPKLTIKVTFTDELTKLPFTAEREVTVNPPPTSPQSQPAAK